MKNFEIQINDKNGEKLRYAKKKKKKRKDNPDKPDIGEEE